ncbi:hypothetical protein BDC45DRAFT_302888 [Circinella umbellata]|nr:hypothetical protein BDC45DRAFT_302888 [Circinella umbellata]
MFTPNDKEKKAFIERTKAQRQQREIERLEKERLVKQENAARILQRWWQRQIRIRQATNECWKTWDELLLHTQTLVDCFQVAGIYCLLCRHHPLKSKRKRLGDMCKCLTKKFITTIDNDNGDKKHQQLTYFALLVDSRYSNKALKYLCTIINQCLDVVCESSMNTHHQQEMYLTGTELNTLLQFLNPKMYQQTNRFLDDKQYLLSSPVSVLTMAVQTVFDECLLKSNIRDPTIVRVQRILKLEHKSNKYSAGVLSSDDGKMIRAIQLWLTTVTRLCLFPIEFFSSSNGNNNNNNERRRQQAIQFICTNILSVPLLPSMINSMMSNHLMKLVGIADIYAEITTTNNSKRRYVDRTMIEIMLSGNGCIFLLGNLIYMAQQLQQQDTSMIITMTNILIEAAQTYFSERQIQPYTNYHPLFKWSSSTWGNSIDTLVFEKVLHSQIEYLWSRTFMDQIFSDILSFDNGNGHATSSSMATTTTKGTDGIKSRLLFKKKKQEDRITIVDGKQHSQLAEFSMDIEAIFSMYLTLSSLFATQRKEIINRIAFTPRLMPQLWRLMNTFGPRGQMSIYLDAARRQQNDEDLEKEPLIKILKVFCEACSLVFLTLDDTDIFENEHPFSVQDLVKLGGFLNTFYFALLQQQQEQPKDMISISTTTVALSSLPASVKSFRASHRLLLQIYDLDVRHPYCPKDHWLLVSDPSMTKSALLALFNPSKQPAVQPFLDRLRQGDPVPLRILQLMPHTVPFNTRLTVFRDWVALDQANLMTAGSRALRVRRQNVLEDGYRGLGGLPPSGWKGNIRVKFINELGMEEAGIDQGGPFKDFVSLLVEEVFKPSVGLFSATSTNNMCYPASTSYIQGPRHIELFEFIGKVIGKAVYEGILLDVQFASFFLAKLLGRNVFLEELREMDEDVWRNLIFLKRYDGCVEDLGLYFTTDEEAFGTVTSHELKYRGGSIAVTNENRIEYIYRMADYKLNQQTREQTRAFIRGFRTVISENWIKVFSPPELQRCH